MKKIAAFSLFLLPALPAFLPWLPHGVAHAVHDYQKSHHQISSHSTSQRYGLGNASHGHNEGTQESLHHVINIDVLTYFSDHLHVDLRSPKPVVLTAPARDSQNIEFLAVANFLPQQGFELAFTQNRGPPDYDWRIFRPDTSLYLTTRRLRI